MEQENLVQENLVQQYLDPERQTLHGAGAGDGVRRLPDALLSRALSRSGFSPANLPRYESLGYFGNS